MKGKFVFGTLMTAALAVTVGAQQPPSGQAPTGQAGQQTGSSPQSRGQAITLSGCVQAAGGQAGGAATGAGAAAAQREGGFVLTNVTAGAGGAAAGAAGPTATGAAGAGATSSRGTTGGTPSGYRLMGGQNLQQYVGQRVEITGTLAGGTGSTGSGAGAGTGVGAGASTPADPASPGRTGAGATGAGAGSTGAPRTGASGSTATGAGENPQGQGNMPALRVTSVKPAAGGGSCTQ